MKQIFFLFSISTFGISSLCQTPTVNNLSKFITTTGTLGNSIIYDNGTLVGIGTTTPTTTLSVAGSGYFSNGLGVGVLNTSAGTLQTSGNATIGNNLAVTNSATFGSSLEIYYSAANNFSTGFNVLKRGTAGDATASVSNNTELGYNGFYGWDGAAYSRGAYEISGTTEAWSTSAHGAYYSIAVTPNGSIENAVALTLGQDKTATLYGNMKVSGIGNSSVAGNLGIGTITPNAYAKLDVNGNIFSSGKILIGINDIAKATTYSLAVNGDAIFNKVRVAAASTWADYVFEDNYSLMPLADLAKYIKINKHLPEVPTTADVQKEGTDIGSIQTLLLKKVEELTLYAIVQNRKAELQQEQITVLMQELAALKMQLKK